MSRSEFPSRATAPEVSVVMSVFNCARSLRETLRSVLDQANCEIEFIVVNDGSTDASAKLLDEVAATDSRMRVLHQTNTGLTRALIAGCAAARAPFIARQDAADISLPGRLERQLAALQADPHLAFVSCGTEFVEPGGALLYRNAGSGRARAPRHVIDLEERYGMADGPSHHGSVMFRREAYFQSGGYRPEFYFGQDWDLWFRLAQLGKFQMVPDTLYRATLAVGDISTSNKASQERLAQLSLLALRLRMDGKTDAAALAQASVIRPGAAHPAGRARIAGANYFLGECLRKNGNFRLSRSYFLQALKKQPWHIKAWLRLAQAATGSGRGLR